MNDNFNREQVIDSMFDPITSSILAELEDGEKYCSFLSKKSSISENEVLERLSYLIETGFIIKNIHDGKLIFSADTDKLTKIVEHSDTFNAAIDGLEKIDSYLN